MKKKEIFEFINSWKEKNIITEEQGICMEKDVRHSLSEKSGRHFVSILLSMGAVAIGAGILLLIASNWSGIPRIVKLILILLLPLIPFAYTYYDFIVRGQKGIFGRVANMLSPALVGGALALFGQTYNLETNPVSFMWMWCLFTVPFVLLFKKRENVFSLTVLVGIALLVQFADWVGYQNESQIIILQSIVSLVYAGALYGLSRLADSSKIWKKNSNLLRSFASWITTILLFITTFNWYSQELLGYSYWSDAPQSNAWIVLAIVFNIVFILFLVFMGYIRIKNQEYRRAFGVVRIFALYLLVKYIVLFSDMFDTGLFMIIGGILFVGGGWYLEKKKSSLIELMKSED